MQVVAHECGHGAFSNNLLVQDTVGYILHSALLVPYFSWQRSHAVHHSRTNHLEEGMRARTGEAPAIWLAMESIDDDLGMVT